MFVLLASKRSTSNTTVEYGPATRSDMRFETKRLIAQGAECIVVTECGTYIQHIWTPAAGWTTEYPALKAV